MKKDESGIVLWREIYHREGLLKIFGSRGIKKGWKETSPEESFL